MTVYFSTNVPELRSIINFNRISLQIANSMRKLETGDRINRAADEPAGLMIREPMRAEIKGIEAARKNATAAGSVLSSADTGLESITKIIRGDLDDDSGMSLLAVIASSDLSSAEKKAIITDRLTLIDGVASSTTYNGKKVIGGDLAYSTSGLNQNVFQTMQIDRANSNASVTIRNTDAAEKGTLTVDNDGFSNDPDQRAAVGDTITVGLQNQSQVRYTLQEGDVNDGKITETAALRIDEALQGSGVTVSFLNGLVFETSDYGDKKTLTVTSDSAVIANTTLDKNGNIASNATGSNARFLVNGNEAWSDGSTLSFYDSDLRFTTNVSDSMLSTQGTSESFRITGGGALFNLGKDVGVNQLKIGIGNASSAFLGGESGTLADLMDLDFDNEADAARAGRIVDEALNSVVRDRSRIGVVVQSVEMTGQSLDAQLTETTAAEAAISNTDVALESSRLAQLELLAQATMNSILFSRSYAQFVAGSLY